MEDTKLIEQPKLDKPGAGLPLIELAIAKYIMFPFLYATTTPEKAVETFADESKRVLALSEKLQPNALSERKLIQRLSGLEDSSRFWSVAMAIQHLVIVGNGMRQVIAELSSTGKTTRSPRGTADVKPDPAVDSKSAILSFEQMADQFLESAKRIDVNAFPAATFPHPWFGDLNARGWLVLSGVHTRIHRKQIEAIIAQL